MLSMQDFHEAKLMAADAGDSFNDQIHEYTQNHERAMEEAKTKFQEEVRRRSRLA